MARKPRNYETDPAVEHEEPEREEGRGRSARKRVSHALTKLGEELLTLKPEQLAALALPERLEEAIAEARRLTSFGAKRRQTQFIGKLLRTLDEDTVAAVRRTLQGG